MDIRDYLAKPDKTIREHIDDLLEVVELLTEMRYIRDAHLEKLLRLACEYHDYGKVNEEFQIRVKSIDKKIRFKSDKEVAHNILSFFFIDRNRFDSLEDFYKVAHAVLHHHNYCDVFPELASKQELIEKLLNPFPHYTLKRSDNSKLANAVNDIEAIKIKGFLHKCDYSASAHYVAEYPNDFLEESMQHLLEKWQEDMPDAKWNELQEFCIANRDSNIMVVAQTGMGKTEAGLHWIGNHKGFFVLPLRTAINAIYDRIKDDIIARKDIDTRLAILHSNSLEYYSKNISQEGLDIFEYQKRGKQFSIPLSISTMDQLFDFVYKYQGFELKLTTFSYSKIVIDEIQMYGPDLLAYLIAGLEAIHEMGGKIAIVTATLAPFVQDCLASIPFNKGVFYNDSIRHNLEIKNTKINSADIFKKYKNNIKNGNSNKILVVCNTVKKAQELYQALRDEYQLKEGKELKLLHSRYIRKDRAEKEKDILLFGKTFTETKELDHQTGIWISTSLVEASLDIDFDYLFTELQDLNSLFQRLGRCNRKGEKDCTYANCFIFIEIDEKYIKKGDKGFIDKTIFELSREAIINSDGPLSEKAKIDLINEYMTTKKLENSDFLREYKELYKQIKEVLPYQYKDIQLRNIQAADIIPSPVYEESKWVIEKNEKILANRLSSNKDKLKAKDEIMKYVVSIPYYDYLYNLRKVKSKEAQSYPSVRIGQYEEIKVIECGYGDLGYQRKEYEGLIRGANIM